MWLGCNSIGMIAFPPPSWHIEKLILVKKGSKKSFTNLKFFYSNQFDLSHAYILNNAKLLPFIKYFEVNVLIEQLEQLQIV